MADKKIASGDGHGGSHDDGHERKNDIRNCPNCKREGHISKDCLERKADTRTCFTCKREGHISKDCPEKKADTRTCFTCKREGHISKDCPEKKDDSRRCFHCNKTGHLKRDCPGLDSKELKAPTPNVFIPLVDTHCHSVKNVSTENTDLRTCFHCNKAGHLKRDCPEMAKKDLEVQPVPSTPIPFVDTHCHLEYIFEHAAHCDSFRKFMEKLSYPDNFAACISTFCDPAAFSSLGLWTSLLEEDKVYGAFGIHPHHAKYYTAALEEKVTAALTHPKCVAFGEIGLDYSFHSPSPRDEQKRVFREQLALALKFKKPIVLHCRNAEEDMKKILLSSSIPPDTGIHFHCCTCSPQTVNELMAAFPNLYIGVTGNVYYNSTKSTVQEIVRNIPLNRILLESDSPFLCPPNMKQKWNHPVKVLEVAARIASLTKSSLEDILRQTTKNAKELYQIEINELT